MPIARKTFSSPFVLEKSKLTRLIEATEAKFRQIATPGHFHFQARLRGEKTIQTAAVEEVLSLDNSQKSRIEGLGMTCTPDNGDPEFARGHMVSVDFDGRAPASVSIIVRGENSAWVNETFSAAEEQVERTLQTSTLSRLSYHGIGGVLVALLGVLALLGLMLSSTSRILPGRLTNSMWLTDQDLKELESLQSDPNFNKRKAEEVLSRQIRNLAQARQERRSVLAWVIQWRTVFVIVPFVLIIAAFSHLYVSCYPQAVFLWGDAEEWYKGILSRRAAVWTSIIIALAVGVLGNLFVLGLHS